ncbi:MAG: BatD family protein [Crocinitomicaceae bacterium]|nr:BatD family protein [Crocinitomicaceae bacterium]
MVKKLQIFLFLFSWITLLIAQEDAVSIEISSNKIELGESFSIHIKTNVEGIIQFELPKELEQIGGISSGMSSRVTYSGGKGIVERYNYNDYKVRAIKEGIISVGPAKVITSQGEITSEIVEIKIEKPIHMLSDDPSGNLDQAVFGLIELSKKEVYLGEPIIAMAKVYSQINILQLEDFAPFKFQGQAEVIPFDVSNQIKNSYENINGINLLTLRLGKTIIFADQTGTFEISPFHLNLYYDHPRSLFPERMRISSNSEVVRVKPLPKNAPPDFIGAVGKMEIQAELLNSTVVQGAVTPLVLTISGRANFLDIEPPSIPLPEGVFLLGEPEIEKNHHFTLNGMEGSTSFTYYLQFEQAGNIVFDQFRFAYFHPRTAKYIQTELPAMVINVTENEHFTPMAVDEIPLENNMYDVDQKMKPIFIERKDNAGKFLVWTTLHKLLVWTPLSLGIIFTFFVKWNNQRSNKKERVMNEVSISNQLLIDLDNFKKKNKSKNSLESLNNLHKMFVKYISFVTQKPINEINNDSIISFFQSKSITNEEMYKLKLFLTKVESIKYGNWIEKDHDLNEWISFFVQLLKRSNG